MARGGKGPSFYPRLQQYFESVAAVLRNEADAASIFPNMPDRGMSRERVYGTFLEGHLPVTCFVTYGGFLFGLDGDESKQMDILVLDGFVPRYNLPSHSGAQKSFACIDGCIGVVSVKSHLDKPQLIDALENLASLPPRKPLMDDDDIDETGVLTHPGDWPYKAIYASSGISGDTLLSHLNAYYRSHPTPARNSPNIIHVAGQYVIWRTGKDPMKMPEGREVPPRTYFKQSVVPDVAALAGVLIGMQRIAALSKLVIYDYGEMYNHLTIGRKEL